MWYEKLLCGQNLNMKVKFLERTKYTFLVSLLLLPFCGCISNLVKFLYIFDKKFNKDLHFALPCSGNLTALLPKEGVCGDPCSYCQIYRNIDSTTGSSMILKKILNTL